MNCCYNFYRNFLVRHLTSSGEATWCQTGTVHVPVSFMVTVTGPTTLHCLWKLCMNLSSLCSQAGGSYGAVLPCGVTYFIKSTLIILSIFSALD